MIIRPRVASAAAGLLGGLILAEPATADTYTFVNPQTGKRIQAECDTDPTKLTAKRRQKHCTVGGTSAALETFLTLDAIKGEAR